MEKLVVKFKAIYSIVFVILICILQLKAQTYKPKKAGVCFRFDDFQSVANLQKIRSLFNKYNIKFTYALNSDLGEILGDEYYWTLIRTMAAEGHEMADQSPSDVSHYIEMKSLTEALTYVNRPGVDHVNATSGRVCLKYSLLNTNGSGDESNIDIKGNMIISKAVGEFSSARLVNLRYTSHFYIPSLNKTVSFTELGNLNSNDVDTAYIKSFWKEDIDLGISSNVSYKKITPYEMTIDKEGVQIMAEHSLKVFGRHNVPLPVSFIHPGGAHPYITNRNLKSALEPLGYKGGASYPIIQNMITEYNPLGIKQFTLQGGDFTPEYNSVQEIKTIIANRYAKNIVMVTINHLNALGAIYPFDQMLVNLEAIIIWCKSNGIPIDTYKNWNTYLTNDFYDQTVDVFPPLQNDFDGDNIPDGLVLSAPSIIDKVNGIGYSNNVCFKMNSKGNVFSISQLAGLSKGKNTFYMSVKGGKDIYDYLTIVMDMPEKGTIKVYSLPLNFATYTEQSFDFDVPSGVTYFNVSVNYQTNKIQQAYISGIKIKSANKTVAKLTGLERKANEAFAPMNLIDNAICSGFKQTQLTWSVLKISANLNAAIKNGTILQINPVNNKFWIGFDSILLRVAAPDNSADTAWLFISSIDSKTCKGQLTDISNNPDSTDKSYSWNAVPSDGSFVNTTASLVRVNPLQNTTYTLNVTNKNNTIKSHSVLLKLNESTLTQGPYDVAHFNGSNVVSFTLSYPDQYKVYFYKNPQAGLTSEINDKTVTLTRTASMLGNMDVKLFVTTPTCDAIIHTLTGTTYTLGLKSMEGQKELNVYPNPFSDLITISNLPDASNSIQIINMNGELLKAFWVNEQSPVLDLSDLKNGFYIIRVLNQNNVHAAKLIK